MRNSVLIFFLSLVCGIGGAQSISNLSFGDDQHLEIITWNVEHFPKADGTTISNMKEIIEALEADVIALQEIDEQGQLDVLASQLPDYTAFYRESSLAFLYRTDQIQIIDKKQIYASDKNKFPRAPLILEFTYKGAKYVVINNHLKCCGNGVLELSDGRDEETRRYRAMNTLKIYVEDHYKIDRVNVFVVGDFNDELDDSPSNNVFQNLIDDAQNFRFADMEIALGSSSNWSFPGYPSHLDHILVTNELFDDLAESETVVKTIRVDNYMGGFYNYDREVSDHRPVGIKIRGNSATSTTNNIPEQKSFKAFPNYVKESCEFRFHAQNEDCFIEIYDLNSRLLDKIHVPAGKNVVIWEPEASLSGMYIARFSSASKQLGVEKLFVK